MDTHLPPSRITRRRCHWVIEKGGKLAEAKLGVKPAEDPKNACVFGHLSPS